MFDIYDSDDIKQEIYILLLKASEKYDPEKGDEFSFLYNFVKNRLKTFKRDNYININSKRSLDKLKIRKARGIEEEDSSTKDNTETKALEESEYFSKIVDCKIPANLRMDYLRLLDGADILYHNKFRLMESIRVIVRANNDKQL